MDTTTDEQLIAQYQGGNNQALELIFMRYQKPILNFALRFVGNRADAEDVTAEVFMVLIEKKDSYKADIQAKFSTWLYTVARNSSLSKIRKQKHTVSLFSKNLSKDQDEPQEMQVPDTHTPADSFKAKEIASHIQQAVQKLPIAQRESFILREFHGLSYEEIVHITGNTLASVKILIFRAREELRKNLGFLLEEVQS